MSFALLPVGGWGEETDEISDYLKISPVKIQEIVIEKLNCLQKDAYEAKTPHVAKLPEKSTLLTQHLSHLVITNPCFFLKSVAKKPGLN